MLGAREVGAEAGPLEAALEVALLGGVAQAREPDVEPLRAEVLEEAADRLRAADRHDDDALRVEVAAAAFRERLDRALVAAPLDEDDRAWTVDRGQAAVQYRSSSTSRSSLMPKWCAISCSTTCLICARSCSSSAP